MKEDYERTEANRRAMIYIMAAEDTDVKIFVETYTTVTQEKRIIKLHSPESLNNPAKDIPCYIQTLVKLSNMEVTHCAASKLS